MHFLLLFLHAVFFTVSYLNGYTVLSWIFLFLGMLFVFYFSPIYSYLLKKWEENSLLQKLSLESFSVESSFIISLFLLYFSLYGIILGTIAWNLSLVAEYHYTVVLGVYVFLVGMYLIFQGQAGTVWYRVLRVHTLFSFIVGLLFLFGVFFDIPYSPTIFFIGSLTPLAVALWYFHETEPEESLDSELYLSLLATIAVLVPAWSYSFFSIHSPLILTMEVALLALLFFEVFPHIHLFRRYEILSRYVGLILSYGTIMMFAFLSFDDLFASLVCLMLLFLFHLSVHIRFENYISFWAAGLALYFVYASIFHGMLIPEVWFFSALMFLFFLPFLLIGLSYFYEEEHTHDLVFLHYGSIAFSILGSVYYLVSLGRFSLVHVSIFALILSGLFFLSYIRLGEKEKIL